MANRHFCGCTLRVSTLVCGILLVIILLIYVAIWIRALVEFYTSSEISDSDIVISLLKSSIIEVLVIILLILDVCTIVMDVMMMISSENRFVQMMWYIPFIILSGVLSVVTLIYVLFSVIIAAGAGDLSDDVTIDIAIGVVSVVYVIIGVSRMIPLILTGVSATMRLIEIKRSIGSANGELIVDEVPRSRMKQSRRNVEEWWDKSTPQLDSPRLPSVRSGSRQSHFSRWDSVDTTTIDGGHGSSIPGFFTRSVQNTDLESAPRSAPRRSFSHHHSISEERYYPDDPHIFTETHSLPMYVSYKKQPPDDRRRDKKDKKHRKDKDKHSKHSGPSRLNTPDRSPHSSFHSINELVMRPGSLGRGYGYGHERPYDQPLYMPGSIPRPHVLNSRH